MLYELEDKKMMEFDFPLLACIQCIWGSRSGKKNWWWMVWFEKMAM